MKELDDERTDVKSQLDRERLTKATNSVIRTITDPAFVNRMQAARKVADGDGGYDEVAQLLSLDGLRQAGADIPDDFRLTSRVFEDRMTGERFEINPGRLVVGDLAPLGWGACAGGGGLTFCGCGGFST